MKYAIVLLLIFSVHSHAYECNGRHYCQEMSTCDEAKWVLRNCPDPRMDGDSDGRPCENTLCRYNPISLNNFMHRS